MTSSAMNKPKEISLRALKVRRFLYLCGTVISAMATLGIIGYAAILLFVRTDLSSIDWWGGIAYYGCLVSLILTVYFFMVIAIIDNAHWKCPAWDYVICTITPAVCESVALSVGMLFFRLLLLLPFFLILLSAHFAATSNTPVLSLTALASFFASSFCSGSLNETNVLIREKTDPNFRRAYGFS